MEGGASGRFGEGEVLKEGDEDRSMKVGITRSSVEGLDAKLMLKNRVLNYRLILIFGWNINTVLI